MTMQITTSATLGSRSRELEQSVASCRYLCFGRFQLDTKREELYRDGGRIRVPAKVFQVLMALLEKPGEVVTREELRAKLWPQGTFVNFDANVNTTVNKLRLVLGGLTGEPAYVQTIPRHGYCFAGTVERRNELAKAHAAAAATAAQSAISDESPVHVSVSSVRETMRARIAGLWSSGWAAAVLLCGVLIGIGIVLVVHRSS